MGDEIRPCWEAADASGTGIPALPGVGPVWPLEADDRTAVQPIQFIEVRSAPTSKRRARSDRPGETGELLSDATAEGPIVAVPNRAEPRWSLWGDAEA